MVGTYYSDWCNATYYNLWSMGNTVTNFNDNAVVKTIYDPCPAGFHMPASNAFTGFTTTGNQASTQSEFNVSGAWDNGWHFNWRPFSSDATVYFSASGSRSYYLGLLVSMDSGGHYWSAVPSSTDCGCLLSFYWGNVYPQDSSFRRAYACSVRPVADD